MLTIMVNGREHKFSIGCRTFVFLDVVLEILKADDRKVTLNGEIICSHEFGKTIVNGGDSLLLSGAL